MPDNPLTDALPAKYRKIAYAVLFVAALAVAAYQGSEGDWWEAAGALLTSLVGALATSNTRSGRRDT